jgi:hypothetical protein
VVPNTVKVGDHFSRLDVSCREETLAGTGNQGLPDLNVSGTDVMILKTFSPKKLAKNGIAQTTAKLCKNWIIKLLFENKFVPFFRRKSAKIAEIRDHNIDPNLF